MLDGTTDMRKAREVLDDRMCLMGDVPSNMLAYGSANDVYDYCTKLIRDVGPKTGLILSSGCDCPLNAKDENVDAMIQASLDFVV
jgi:uroporphyrinogen-III decarboxylase